MKEQYKTLEEELSEVEISLLFFNLHEKEFRVVIVKIIKEFGKRMDAHWEVRSFKQREYIKNNQTEMKKTRIEMKNTLEKISNRLNYTEE